MDAVTMGKNIRIFRERRKLTQSVLADKLNVSDKAVSRWETGKGFPDFSLISQLSEALGISVTELLAGESAVNRNVSGNVLRGKFYICPVCSNTLFAMGECVVGCCGMTLPPLEADDAETAGHLLHVEMIEDEFYVTSPHSMSKEHHLSFIAYVTDNRAEIVKLYPEGSAEARFFIRGDGYLYTYCNHHGLMRQRIRRP